MSEKTSDIKSENNGFSTDPRIKFIEDAEIINDKGDLIFDEFSFIRPDTQDDHFIIATPNIPLVKLDDLKRNFRRDADGGNLDLSVSIHTSIDNTPDKGDGSWEMGWDDGDRVYVDIYPKEFFESQTNAREVFEQEIVPSFSKVR